MYESLINSAKLFVSRFAFILIHRCNKETRNPYFYIFYNYNELIGGLSPLLTLNKSKLSVYSGVYLPPIHPR